VSKFEQVLQDWASEQKSDIESIEHLDFDPEQPCECKAPDGSPCTATATWVGRHRCCGFSWLLCTPHKQQAIVALVALPAVECEMCRAKFHIAVLSTEFILIGGRS
jgi:hypothetical protein